jgi:hypothetical protein
MDIIDETGGQTEAQLVGGPLDGQIVTRNPALPCGFSEAVSIPYRVVRVDPEHATHSSAYYTLAIRACGQRRYFAYKFQRSN